MIRFAAATGLLAAAAPASAQPEIVADSGDSAWVLAAALIALLAVAGLARGRVAIGVAAGSLLVWAVAGYSIAFAAGSGILGGLGNFLLRDLAPLRDGSTIGESTFALFQASSALIATALVAAAVGARARAAWLVGFMPLWVLLIYAPVTHWVAEGWLSDLGVVDYAGGIFLLTAAGTSQLAVAALIGWSEERPMPPMKPTLIAIGWLALAGGAALAAGDDAATALLDVLLGGAASAMVWFALSRGDLDALAPGLLAGLGVASAAAGYAAPSGALVLGLIGGGLAWTAARALRRTPVDGTVIALCTGGAVGALLVPLTALAALDGPGLAEGQTWLSFAGAQAVAVLAVALWSGVATVIAALMVSMVAPMRARSVRTDRET